MYPSPNTLRELIYQSHNENKPEAKKQYAVQVLHSLHCVALCIAIVSKGSVVLPVVMVVRAGRLTEGKVGGGGISILSLANTPCYVDIEIPRANL